MSKVKTLINDVKEHISVLKDTIESEKFKGLRQKINELNFKIQDLEKENIQLRELLTRVIEDIDKENRRNRKLLSSLNKL